jgi:hypothetical protein
MSVPLPSPMALRLVCRPGAARVKPPLGLTRWSDDATDLALLLDRPSAGDAPTLAEIATALPAPFTLTPGALVIILGELAPRGPLGWLGSRVRVPRHLRSSALLAAGYTRIGGAADPKAGGDLAWGYAPGANDPA